MKPFKCIVCKKYKDTGYGIDRKDNKVCYKCCGIQDWENMKKTGKAMLYLVDDKVTNWPGTLIFKVEFKKTGRHNISGKRYDVWFSDKDNKHWHGVTYGDMTQICHTRRIK